MAEPRTALVTGANRGLGLEVCRQLEARGFSVVATSRDGARGEPLDVADPESAVRLAERLRGAGRRLQVLVNNAGIALDGFDAEVVRRTLEVNFFGAMRVTDALLPLLDDGGNIVMVSSGLGTRSYLGEKLRSAFADAKLGRDALAALMGQFARDVESGTHRKAGWPSSAYAVSKVGINALASVLARELAGRRIHVNAVCPGWVRTDMGGPGASRSVEDGAASIVWAAAQEGGPTGGFFRDGKPIPW